METRGTVFEMCGEENGEACDFSAHEIGVLILGVWFRNFRFGIACWVKEAGRRWEYWYWRWHGC